MTAPQSRADLIYSGISRVSRPGDPERVRRWVFERIHRFLYGIGDPHLPVPTLAMLGLERPDNIVQLHARFTVIKTATPRPVDPADLQYL